MDKSQGLTPQSRFFRSDEAVILSVDRLQMRYGGKRAVETLDDFSLDVHKGEFICILGPSGCGKSTLLSVVAGILRPTGGSVTMNGRPITGMDWHRTLMFQSPTLYPWLSAYDNVAFGPRMRRMPRAAVDERVRRYLELVGLTEFAAAKPYELSGGMKQRVALARALVSEPSVILMDEPFGALDAFTRTNMQVLIRDIWRKHNNTLLLITHDVDEALALASRVVVMSARPGRLVGMFDAMFSHPLTGTAEDDAVRASDEYVKLRRAILNLIDTGEGKNR
ncbi:MAG: ABC transporter ATP-binding protein [Clostridiales bacterium]|nr:ABC transporter ATP-binding protein [Clostridiales bacterium]